ncbi:tautomerase family protein [Pengzhenrongella sicca]|uniref:Tautomerase family protein n=1 Tax=Pengzhenrongella sicca TaxID=2819238 RepID=A0A8A4ZHT4_9MICO|nr:tautomerase family protein [Pengzhenrongella sicca]QTE30086.1 tautomerase family protein [Pengzhenrongella sicca]
MPLVRIDLNQGRTAAQLREIADAVQEVMLDVFAAPPGDRYQIVTEHPAGQVIAEGSGLGIERSDALVMIQVFHQGRSVEQKTRAYAGLSRILAERAGLAPGDLIVSMVENTKEDWSFAGGRAQFLTGEL